MNTQNGNSSEKKKGKVVVGMSGGVDSSVTAALLVQQGYDVSGMMLKLWSEPGKENENKCCTLDSMAQAKHVASLLDIPFYSIDARRPFKKTVVDYFITAYLDGLTPNPCLLCNRSIRWGLMLEHALAIGAEYMATGHYARTRTSPDGHIQLLKAADKSKDQSYVLHVLNQEQMKKTMFPLGGYSKQTVRKLARQFGLPVSERPDSQDLCFLGNEPYKEFLLRNAPAAKNPGKIIDIDGNILGEHQGLAFYTIGQRKGIGIASAQALYVIEKRIEDNALIVGTAGELGRDELIAANVNWIAGKPPAGSTRGQTKIRYRSAEIDSEFTPLPDGTVRVKFFRPLRDITPGQSAVFYQGDVCLGGGVILP